jgi:hypothetical protein
VNAINPYTNDALMYTRIEDTSDVSFGTKDKTKEWWRHGARTLSEKLQCGTRTATTVADKYTIYALVDYDERLSFSAVCSSNYPKTTAFSLLAELRHRFTTEYPGDMWKTETKDKDLEIPGLKKMFKDAKDPKNYEMIDIANFKAQDLTEVLTKNIEELFDNQAQVDENVRQARDLSIVNKEFYKKASKLESKEKPCCIIF